MILQTLQTLMIHRAAVLALAAVEMKMEVAAAAAECVAAVAAAEVAAADERSTIILQ